MFREPCPICHALIAYESGSDVRCDQCGNCLLVANSDPTGHDLNEIDPEVPGGGFGVFHLKLHPKGTQVCVLCQQIYPSKFECCPNLVDVAFAAYNVPADNWGPNTQVRIAEFLRSNKMAVANTAQLRIWQSRHWERPRDVGDRLIRLLKELGLSSVIEEIADDLE